MIPPTGGEGRGGGTGRERAMIVLAVGDGPEGVAVKRPTKGVLGVKQMTDVVFTVLFVVPRPRLPHASRVPALLSILGRMRRVGGKGNMGSRAQVVVQSLPAPGRKTVGFVFGEAVPPEDRIVFPFPLEHFFYAPLVVLCVIEG